jgi:molybdenum cofactor biosynthesis enzyme MoaA
MKDPKIVDWRKVLVDGAELGCRQVQFIGGEPTTHPELAEFISLAHELGYEFIEVYTNLTMVSDRLLETLTKYRVHIATSFYSANPEIHDRITGTKGSFRKTVEGIRRILDAGLTLRAGIVVTDQNRDGVDEATRFLVSMGVDKDWIGVDHIRPVGRGLDLASYHSLEETLCGKCWQGRLTVSWNGACYPCVFARQVNVGNVAKSSLKEIVYSEPLSSFRTRIYNYAGQGTSQNGKWSSPLRQLGRVVRSGIDGLKPPSKLSLGQVILIGMLIVAPILAVGTLTIPHGAATNLGLAGYMGLQQQFNSTYYQQPSQTVVILVPTTQTVTSTVQVTVNQTMVSSMVQTVTNTASVSVTITQTTQAQPSSSLDTNSVIVGVVIGAIIGTIVGAAAVYIATHPRRFKSEPVCSPECVPACIPPHPHPRPRD